MARQAGILRITGCIDNLCFYKMDGKYYVRMKSSLTGKRVKKDPAFKRTMQYAARLASAAKIASVLYRELPKEEKGIAVYRMLTGKVMHLLKDGKSSEEILHILSKPTNVSTDKHKYNKQLKPTVTPDAFANMIIARAFADILTEEEENLFVAEESSAVTRE